MTIYWDIKEQAEAAARLGVAIVEGEDPPEGLLNGEVNNGLKDVPAFLVELIPVTVEDIESTIIEDGFWTRAQICTERIEAACERAGL